MSKTLSSNEDSDLFSSLGLEVTSGEVEVGNVYPVFGAITRFIDETPGAVVAELNNHIIIKMNVPDETRLSVLRERAFETGIFISKVVEKDPSITLECQTVIFGKKQSYNA